MVCSKQIPPAKVSGLVSQIIKHILHQLTIGLVNPEASVCVCVCVCVLSGILLEGGGGERGVGKGGASVSSSVLCCLIWSQSHGIGCLQKKSSNLQMILF